jgi:hypothetical protein
MVNFIQLEEFMTITKPFWAVVLQKGTRGLVQFKYEKNFSSYITQSGVIVLTRSIN